MTLVQITLNLARSMLVCLLLAPGLSQAHEQQQYTVAFAQDTLANDWRRAQVEQLRESLNQHPNIKLIVTDARGSSAQQIRDIEDHAYSKVDLIITSPRNGIAAAPAIGKIYRSGIPVVLMTRKIPSDEFTTIVAPDDYQIAHQAAELIAQKLNFKGRVIMLEGVPTASTARARKKGFIETLKKYPGIQLVATGTGNYLRADAIRAMEKILAQGIVFDAIYSHSDSMASGARLALNKHGISPADKIIVGIDYIKEARDAILKGNQTASFLYPTCGKETAKVVLDILHGKKTAKSVVVESQLITRENAQRVTPIF